MNIDLSIIGCGNATRSDDGLGLHVAGLLQSYVAENELDHVHVYDAGNAGMEVMFHARGSKACILIDACLSKSEPGSIFILSGSELENRSNQMISLHEFRWDHALYAGRKLFKSGFPSRITVYLIEAESTDFGLNLSPKVADAAKKVFDRIVCQLHERSA